MNSNLMTELMNDFRGDSLSSISSVVGESPATTHSVIAAALPALIGGLAYKTSTAAQASKLLDVITSNKLDSDTFATPSSAVRAPGGIDSLMNVGRPLLASIFGTRSGAITDWVASRSGVSRSSSSSLLSIALPIVLGLIAKRLHSTGWSASNLMRLMADQRAYLQDAPAELAGVLGEEPTTTRYVRTDAEDVRRRHASAAPVYETAPTNRNAWLWALPLLLLIPLVGYFLTRHDEPRREIAVQPTTPQEAVPAVPEEKPVGTSSEPEAVPARPYELRFATGSQLLTAESAQRLREIADIMRAHPRAMATIKGYTDNAGNDAANLELSKDRAMAVMNDIADLGIDRSRMTAEGYGEASPVATNATAQGREQNRRVEVQLNDR